MVARSRRSGARSMARGVFATLWILLAGCSGLYLFTLLTDPSALQFSALAGGAREIPTGDGPLSAGDTARLKESLQALSEQMEAIGTRLQAAEDYVPPVAALPEPPPPPAAEPEPEPEAPAEEVVVEDTEVETEVVEAEPAAPEPEAPPPMVVATPPAPEPAVPEPVVAAPKPPVTVDAPVVVDPPAVAAAPMEPEPEPDPVSSAASQPEPEPAAPAEIAAFDPVTLPPAANDGSTRYGIEIGTVGQRDQLRPLWREFLTNHAALVAGLQPRRVLAPDKKWRLIAGPFANAQDAEGACSLFKKADRPCAATVYAGDAL